MHGGVGVERGEGVGGGGWLTMVALQKLINRGETMPGLIEGGVG